MTDAPLTMRQATLLTFLSFVPSGSRGLDPVRIVKGLFVVAQELHETFLPQEGKYEFVPYDYGPFSRRIYDDLDRLRNQGLIVATEAPGRNWKYLRLSEVGAIAAVGARGMLHPNAVQYLEAVCHWVSGQTFAGLLRTIYDRYPSYAVNSVFERPDGQ